MKGLLNRQHYYAGQTVFHEGEPGYKMFVVESGAVLIWTGNDAEKKVEIAVITKGGIFGEMAVFDGGPRMASATAVEAATLLVIDGKHLRDAMRHTDPIIDKMMRVVLESARDLGHQLHRARVENAKLEETVRALSGGVETEAGQEPTASERG